MNRSGKYIFTSTRLGFRDWQEQDIGPMAAINEDSEVMEFFPATQSREQTVAFISRMQAQLAEKRFIYFAVDRLDTGAFIGFIGMSVPTFIADFTPCVDMGWRLSRQSWGNGFATEGALRCLEYAFNELGIPELFAIAPKVNVKSEQVMQKIGMKKVKHFKHPSLVNDAWLEECVLYKIEAGENTLTSPQKS